MRHAACLLSDIGWRVHPDHRGEQTLSLVVNGNFGAISHHGPRLRRPVGVLPLCGPERGERAAGDDAGTADTGAARTRPSAGRGVPRRASDLGGAPGRAAGHAFPQPGPQSDAGVRAPARSTSSPTASAAASSSSPAWSAAPARSCGARRRDALTPLSAGSCAALLSLRRRQIEPTTSTTTTPSKAQQIFGAAAAMGEMRRDAQATPSIVSSEAPNGPSNSACSFGAIAGSVAMTSPAIQPSSAAPAQTRIGSLSSSAMISAAPATIRGMLIARPRTSSGTLPLAAAATAMTLSRLMTMSATTTICTACPQMRGRLDAVLVLVLRHQQLCRDHDQREAADQLEVGQLHQARDDAGEDDAQQHGGAGAEDHAPQPMPRLQPAAGQRDHQRVVAGQQDVDPDDLADRNPERRLLPSRCETG